MDYFDLVHISPRLRSFLSHLPQRLLQSTSAHRILQCLLFAATSSLDLDLKQVYFEKGMIVLFYLSKYTLQKSLVCRQEDKFTDS